MDNWWPAVCCSAWMIAPVLTFVLGLKVGKGEVRVPFRVRIERREEEYAVDSD